MELLEGTEDSKITIATDKLSVGVDVPDFQMVVIIDPKDINDLWQKAGRVGRDCTKVKNPMVVIYFLSAVVKLMQKQKDTGIAATTKKKKKSHSSQSTTDSSIDDGLLQVFFSPCFPKEVDKQYQNPPNDLPCSPACTTCRLSPLLLPPMLCNYSHCLPEQLPTPLPRSGKPRKPIMPLAICVTKEMREVAQEQFLELREELWECADELSTGMVPMESYLPDDVIDNILDVFPTILSKNKLSPLVEFEGRLPKVDTFKILINPFIKNVRGLHGHQARLLEVIWAIHLRFDKIRQRKKDDAKAKCAAKKDEENIH